MYDISSAYRLGVQGGPARVNRDVVQYYVLISTAALFNSDFFSGFWAVPPDETGHGDGCGHRKDGKFLSTASNAGVPADAVRNLLCPATAAQKS